MIESNNKGEARGTHGTLSRFDVRNIFVAAGPDFRGRMRSDLPSSNLDVAATIMHLLELKPPQPLDGRVLREAIARSRKSTRSRNARRGSDHRKVAAIFARLDSGPDRILRRRQRRSHREVMSEAVKIAVASVNNLVVRHGTQTVLDGATLTILEGERVGLVGRNGSGKSTFLQIASGATLPDSGDVALRRDLVTGYMPQVFNLDDARSVHANILSGAQRVLDLLAEYETVPPESTQSGLLLEQIQHADGSGSRASDQVAHQQPARAGRRSHRRHAFRRRKATRSPFAARFFLARISSSSMNQRTIPTIRCRRPGC